MIWKAFPLAWLLMALTGCTSIKLPITELYQLTQFSHKTYKTPHGNNTLFVSPPEAFEVKSFAHHAWLGAPAQMIHPLLTQSLQLSGYFKAVSSGIYSDKTDYRLDSQLLMMQQNFIHKPSQLFLVMKLVLNDVSNTKLIASKIFQYRIPCSSETPYGGVLAANQAVRLFTQDAVKFVSENID
jgi:cholesterol transport system auxiliary component